MNEIGQFLVVAAPSQTDQEDELHNLTKQYQKFRTRVNPVKEEIAELSHR